ncbi:hypothetical protein Tco_1273530 [Tanacetum coccineum]
MSRVFIYFVGGRLKKRKRHVYRVQKPCSDLITRSDLRKQVKNLLDKTRAGNCSNTVSPFFLSSAVLILSKVFYGVVSMGTCCVVRGVIGHQAYGITLGVDTLINICSRSGISALQSGLTLGLVEFSDKALRTADIVTSYSWEGLA